MYYLSAISPSHCCYHYYLATTMQTFIILRTFLQSISCEEMYNEYFIINNQQDTKSKNLNLQNNYVDNYKR